MSKPTWFRSSLPDYIVIYASKLAGCAGMHPYSPQHEYAAELTAYLGNDKTFISTVDQAKELVETMSPEIKAMMHADYANATDVQHVLSQIQEDNSVSKEVYDVVRSSLYTAQGIRDENTIRINVQAKNNISIKTDCKFKVCKTPLCTVHGVEVYIGGKHDGISSEQKIIEIKNRQKRFMGVPLYEKVQVHAYMYIYGCKSAVLVESYLGETREHDVPFDEEFFGIIKSNLADFLYPLIRF